MSASSPWPTEPAAYPPPAQPNHAPSEPAADLDLMKVLFGQKLLLIFFVLIGLGVGYVLFTKAKPVFSSSTRVRVYQTRPMASAIDGRSVLNAPPPLDTYAVLITSPNHVQKSIAELHDGDLVAASGAGIATYVADGLTVAPSPTNKEFLDFSFVGPNPSDCQKILNAVVNSFLKYLEDSQRGDTDKAIRLIESAQDVLNEDLAKKQEAYNAFKAKSPLVFVGEKARNLHQERMSQIEDTRSTLLIQESQLKSELDAIEAALKQGASRETLLLMIDTASRLKNDSNSPAGSTLSPAPTLSGQLLPLVFEEEKLLQSLGSEHPRVREVRRKIELTRAMFEQREPDTGEQPKNRADWLTIYVDSLRQGVGKIQQQRADLNLLFDEERDAARNLSDQENKDQTFREDIERTSRLFDTVVDQLQTLSLVKDSGTIKAELVSLPAYGQQVGPSFAKYLGGGGVLGWLCALAISFLIESSNRGFRGLEDVSRRLHLPVLGTVPLIEQKPARRDLRSKLIDRMGICFHKPASFAAEAYRAVRSSIMLGKHGQEIRVLQITSSDAGAGKSTLSANLAISVAQSGKRCLLIDADCRRPTQHKMFGLPNTTGLSAVIQETQEIPEAIRTTDVPGLDLMTAGPRPANPSELLMSEAFRNLLEKMRETYDFVIVDTPPVLAVTDACIVSPHTDGVLFLTRLGRNARVLCTRGLDRLRMVGAKVLGIVLNAVPIEKSEYGLGRYQYGYRYGYGYINEEYFKEPKGIPTETTAKNS